MTVKWNQKIGNAKEGSCLVVVVVETATMLLRLSQLQIYNIANKKSIQTNKELKNKSREVNTTAAQSRGLSSLRIDLKVCQTSPSNWF
jgi:hypothetical protein